MSERNRQAVRAFIEALSSGDAAAMAECLAPGAVAVTKGFTNFTGTSDRETILRAVDGMKGVVPTGLRLSAPQLIAEGNTVVAEFEGNALTAHGTPYCNQYCMVFWLADGKIVRTHEYFCTKLAEEVLWPVVAQAGLAADIRGN